MLARRVEVTISGAGKLVSRAAELDLLVEVSGRQAWRTYMTRDLAIAFGFGVRPVGRPPAPPQALPDFIPALAEFDREMAELDSMLAGLGIDVRSEEHTSELQSLMRISYAVFCLKKKNKQQTTHL